MSPVAHHESPEPRASHAATRGDAAVGPARDRLARLQRLVSLIEAAIDDPSLRTSLPAWQAQSHQTHAAPGERADARRTLRRPGHADPIVRRAFEAVVTGCDRLAATAADILASGDVRAREAAGLVRRMQVLLDRAAALLDDGDAYAADAAARRIARLYAR